MLNKVQLIGHLGEDPAIRSMNAGGEVATLSVATSDHWKDRDGNQQERTDWHRVVIFDPQLVDVAKKYARKGSRIYVEGQMQTRKWTDQGGQDRYTTEVVLQRFRGGLRLLDRREGQQRGAANDQGAPEQRREPPQRPQPAFDHDLDDGVPF
jgi:single-strand DNA-binding protein